jgi:hypothetical protein
MTMLSMQKLGAFIGDDRIQFIFFAGSESLSMLLKVPKTLEHRMPKIVSQPETESNQLAHLLQYLGISI